MAAICCGARYHRGVTLLSDMGAQPLRRRVPEVCAASRGARRPDRGRAQARDAEALPESPDAMGDRYPRQLEINVRHRGAAISPRDDQPSMFRSAGWAPVLDWEIR